ncbi:unnamed protein product [Coccothraustes coccothraustes]
MIGKCFLCQHSFSLSDIVKKLFAKMRNTRDAKGTDPEFSEDREMIFLLAQFLLARHHQKAFRKDAPYKRRRSNRYGALRSFSLQDIVKKLFAKMRNTRDAKGTDLEFSEVCQSLLPLLFHCQDENQRVAEASQETLLCVVKFMKRRDFKKLVKEEKLWKFSKCLLAEDRSRAAEHLHRALRYLQSPQEPLQEAAIRFMGSDVLQKSAHLPPEPSRAAEHQAGDLEIIYHLHGHWPPKHNP